MITTFLAKIKLNLKRTANKVWNFPVWNFQNSALLFHLQIQNIVKLAMEEPAYQTKPSLQRCTEKASQADSWNYLHELKTVGAKS